MNKMMLEAAGKQTEEVVLEGIKEKVKGGGEEQKAVGGKENEKKRRWRRGRQCRRRRWESR